MNRLYIIRHSSCSEKVISSLCCIYPHYVSVKLTKTVELRWLWQPFHLGAAEAFARQAASSSYDHHYRHLSISSSMAIQNPDG